MDRNDYQYEFTEARMNLLPPQYTRCRIWYDEEDKQGNRDSYRPPLILTSTGNGKSRRWKDGNGYYYYSNKGLVNLIRQEICDWHDMSPNHYLSVDFTSKDGEYMDGIDDIFAKGTLTFERFPNYREHPNTYKGKRTPHPKKNRITNLQNSVRNMF